MICDDYASASEPKRFTSELCLHPTPSLGRRSVPRAADATVIQKGKPMRLHVEVDAGVESQALRFWPSCGRSLKESPKRVRSLSRHSTED